MRVNQPVLPTDLGRVETSIVKILVTYHGDHSLGIQLRNVWAATAESILAMVGRVGKVIGGRNTGPSLTSLTVVIIAPDKFTGRILS